MWVFVLTDMYLRMGCLTTLLRCVDADPGVKVEFVKDLPPSIEADEDEPIYILKPDAEVMDVAALASIPTPLYPFFVEGVSGLHLGDSRIVKCKEWFLIGVHRRHWADLLENGVGGMTQRHVPMSTSFEYTFSGDMGQRNLLRLR